MQTRILASLVLGLFLCGCNAAPAPPPFKPVADVKQLMTTVIDPAADVIWAAVGVIDSEKGVEEHAPKTDEEWAVVRNSAYIMAESGNLMMMSPRAKDAGEWMKHSQALIDAGIKTIRVTDARDKDALFTVGGEVYEVCANCHRAYLVTAEGTPR